MTDREDVLGVLVVDDSTDFLNAAVAWIGQERSLRVVGTANSGAEALDAVALLRPDLVLMDAFMPDLDGFEVTRRIKAQPNAPLVVIVSVHEGSAMEREARNAGAEAFVPKSEFSRVLPETIRELASRDGYRQGTIGGPVDDRPILFH